MALDPDYVRDTKLAGLLGDRIWTAFFSNFGRLREIQKKSIPLILDGQDLLISAATASGKTEAACAPLVRRCQKKYGNQWTILYVCPTRALVNDLYQRLRTPVEGANFSIHRRTGDYTAKLTQHKNILITTPESFDSLMCRGKYEDGSGHILSNVNAIVLDEIHLLHGSPRGEMVRWLIARLKKLRENAKNKGWAVDDRVQVIALSATVSDPKSISDQYLSNGQLISSPGSRDIKTFGNGGNIQNELPEYLRSTEKKEKVLVFCRSRKKSEKLSEDLKGKLKRLGYSTAVHHGSLPKKDRENAESKFKNQSSVVMFSTSTLELGIDIGDVDLVVLDGPPTSVSSFLQRIGRGNRRSSETRIMLCANHPSDVLLNKSLLSAARNNQLFEERKGSHLSVAIQQIASYIFQSPNKTRSKKHVEKLIEKLADKNFRFNLLDHLIKSKQLKDAGKDAISLGQNWLDKTDYGGIHSVIESSPGSQVVDDKTGNILAESVKFQGDNQIGLRGKRFDVIDSSNGSIIVGESGKTSEQSGWGYISNPRARFDNPTLAIQSHLGFRADQWVLANERWLFHFGGRSRKIILDAAKHKIDGVKSITDFYIEFYDSDADFDGILNIKMSDIESAIKGEEKSFEHKLGLPYASDGLPNDLRRAQILDWLNIENEIKACQSKEIVEAETAQAKELALLFD